MVKISKDERPAYIRGVMETCQAMSVTADVTAAVCQDLHITGKEIAEFGKECKAHGKVDDHMPQVQG